MKLGGASEQVYLATNRREAMSRRKVGSREDVGKSLENPLPPYLGLCPTVRRGPLSECEGQAPPGR